MQYNKENGALRPLCYPKLSHHTDIWLHCFQLEAENNVVVLLDQTERTTGDTITFDYMLGKLPAGWVFSVQSMVLQLDGSVAAPWS